MPEKILIPAKYRREGLTREDFACVVKTNGTRKALYPLKPKKRVINAAVRMEVHKDEPNTRACIQQGLKGKICSAYRRYGMTDQEWYQKRCK